MYYNIGIAKDGNVFKQRTLILIQLTIHKNVCFVLNTLLILKRLNIKMKL